MKIIQKEKPDGILLSFGGQTALNCGIELYEKGILEKYDLKVRYSPEVRTSPRMLDKIKVKGKNEPVTIYEPLGPTAEIDVKTSEELKEYAAALDSYLKQEWQIASAALQQLMQQYEPRKIYQIYLDRITVYQKESPGESWDGVFTHITK